MNEQPLFEKSQGPHNEYTKLAVWLQQVLRVSPLEKQDTASKTESSLDLVLDSKYHLHFYQQIPDFATALLNKDAQATIRYAPLLYHLAGCHECHSAYLDIYDSLRAALQPKGERPLLGQGTRTLAGMPQRMLGHLAEVLISQAEAQLLEGRRQDIDMDETARALLQLTLKIAARITQSSVRQRALRDLVRVATLSEGSSLTEQRDAEHTYTPSFAGSTGARPNKKVVRRADMLSRSSAEDQSTLFLRANRREGRIVQREAMLELHLQDLEPDLRGKYVMISVPLGSLIEPVRWIGGNPRAIQSAIPVSADGTLVMPLGQTELRLSNNEERNLLEAMFMLLEVRAVHQAG